MRTYIEGLLQSRHMSLTQMAARLGYRSKTSLCRLMDGHVRDVSVRDFEQRVMNRLELTAEEREALHDAAQVKMFGREAWLMDQEMWAYLRQDGIPEMNGEPEIRDADSGETLDINELLSDAEDLRITIFNCQHVPLYENLRVLMDERRALVTHYLYTGPTGREVLHDLRSLSPVLYRQDYKVYANSEAEYNPMDGRTKGDTMVLSCRKRGEEMEAMIHFVRPALGMYLSRRGRPGAILRLIGLDMERYREIKAPLYERCDASDPITYVNYVRMCRDVEYNRAALILRPNPCINTIPPEIAGAALTHNFPEDIRSQLLEIHAQRFDHLITRRKQTHITMKQSALRHLALTGTVTDQFWGLRPFTPEERIVWLEKLLNEQLTNPYIHLHFLRDESVVSDQEFTWYEGVGLLNIHGDSHYNLAAGHAEALITNPIVVNHFHDFYLKRLVMGSCLNEAETCEILRGLIALVRSKAGKEDA